jgi:TrmH family RNA methyltransferase
MGCFPVPQRIDSLSNPHLKKLKRLHRVHTDQRQFLVEGTHLVTEAIRMQWHLESVYYTDDWLQSNASLLQTALDSMEQYQVAPRWLRQAATTEHPDGILAVANLPDEKACELSHNSKDWSLTIAADGVQDPGNAGTLLRMAVATGANRLFLSPDSVSPIHPKMLRSTAGQWFRSPPQAISMEVLISHAKKLGVRVLVADMRGEPIWDIDLRVPTLFVVGNEGSGVRPETKRMADAICTVPMASGVESLNVASAGTILLYETLRQRNLAQV